MLLNKIDENNFDFLRLLFAAFVVVTHSYFFTGYGDKDFLYSFTQGQTTLSYIGVRGFFIISGYLIFQSVQRSSSFNNYLWKRFLRLYPALFIALVFTVCICFFLYEGTLKQYLTNVDTWTYVTNNILLYNLQYGIKGVLNGDAINGSIWTIKYEFSFYIMLSVFFLFKKSYKNVTYLLVLFFLFLLVGKFYFFEKLGNIGLVFSKSLSLNLGLFFIAGSLIASFKVEFLRNKYLIVFFGILLLFFSFKFKYFNFWQFLLLPIIVLQFGFSSLKYINSMSNKIGDLSYGVYLYSFPIQMFLTYFFKFNVIQLIIISLILSLFLGFLSWNLVEKKALKYKGIKFMNGFRKSTEFDINSIK
jgi:peptidoglycan/LPS O-acetylase OafA/YrhL